ncbi:MAG: type II secretion system F family protein [Candidatus Diapherotrites archaeon]
MYKKIAAFIPSGIIKAFRREMDYLNIDLSEKTVVGFIVVYGAALSLGIALCAFAFIGVDIAATFLASFVLFCVGTYLWLSIAAESKGKLVDSILPDALQLIAANIKAGLTTERALLVSARPEFGPLEAELKATGRRIMAGIPLEVALEEIPRKIKSETLERMIWLISKGIESGGQIADLLTHLSDDMREQNSVKDEISANVSMYVLLIFFSSAMGGPILFGVSSFIVQILGAQTANMPHLDISSLPGGGGSSAGIAAMASGGGASIPPDFVMLFSEICLVVTAIFAALTMGVINTGKEQGGAKFIPIILVISFVLFFAVREVLKAVFGNLLM